MTALDLILETEKFYTENPNKRGIKINTNGFQDGCQYLTDDGRKCAIGRCMITPTTTMNGDPYGLWDENLRDNNEISKLIFEDILKPEYKGLSIELWKSLQMWHDNPDNWDKNGLTNKGKVEMYDIKSQFKL